MAVIEYKLRQEKRGAFLLDRRRGAALSLPAAAFPFLQALDAAGAIPSDWPQAGLARYFGANPEDGWRCWQTLEQTGLITHGGLRPLQLIPLNDPAGMPDDCLAAPTRVYFELTRRCNLACHTCFNNSRYPLADELTTAEIFDILEQLNRMGTFEIRFTGGEPTEHPDFKAIIAFAKACGFYISLGTNGVYSDEKRSWIYESGIDWFIVSLDGPEAINDRVRGTGSYHQVVQTLQELRQHQPPLRARLNMVVARHNVQSIEALARLADKNGVESLNMIPLRPYGRSVKLMVDNMFDQSGFYAFIQHIQELRRRYRVQFITSLDLLDPEATTSHDLIVQKKLTCAAGVEATVIGATGDVYGCSYSPASFPDSPDRAGRRLFVAGNVRQDPLNSIWRDSSRWAVFRHLESYKNQRCLTCAHYSVRCVGSCQIMGYFEAKQPKAFDPYCFVDLLPACTLEES